MSGILFVVSGPSGAGKSTICTRLRAEFPELVLSVSYTTRAPRGTEQDGVDYHFVSVDTFQSMIAEERFVEWAEVHGNFYGTAFSAIRTQLDEGKSVLFDIDYQGAANLRKVFPDAVTVMVLPPSLEELERRLRGRETDSEEVIEQRLKNAYGEIQQAGAFDYLVFNVDLARASDEMRAIYLAAGCQRQRRRVELAKYLGIELP